MVKQTFDALKKKHKLPSFEELDSEFGISSIEHKEGLSVSIRKKIAERIEPALDFIDHLLQPDAGSIADMYECKYVTEEDKKHLFTIYSKLMRAYRAMLELDLKNKEEDDCTFIKDFSKEWQQIRTDLIPIVDKVKNSWDKPAEAEEVLSYFG